MVTRSPWRKFMSPMFFEHFDPILQRILLQNSAEVINVTTFLLVVNIIAPSKNAFSWFTQFSNV